MADNLSGGDDDEIVEPTQQPVPPSSPHSALLRIQDSETSNSCDSVTELRVDGPDLQGKVAECLPNTVAAGSNVLVVNSAAKFFLVVK